MVKSLDTTASSVYLQGMGEGTGCSPQRTCGADLCRYGLLGRATPFSAQPHAAVQLHTVQACHVLWPSLQIRGRHARDPQAALQALARAQAGSGAWTSL